MPDWQPPWQRPLTLSIVTWSSQFVSDPHTCTTAMPADTIIGIVVMIVTTVIQAAIRSVITSATIARKMRMIDGTGTTTADGIDTTISNTGIYITG